MAWDDFGDYSDTGSGYDDYGTVDTNWGSYAPEDYSFIQNPNTPMMTADILGSQGMYSPNSLADPSGQFMQGQMADPSGSIGGAGGAGGLMGGLGKLLGLGGAGAGAAGGAGAGGAQQGGLMSILPQLLGLGGGLAGMAGQIAGGGVKQTQQPVMNTAAKGAMGSANSMLGQLAQGNSPLQQMQMSLLQALASGQGLPPGYEQLVEQAFQPKMGSLYEQATNQGRARGFHDAPAQSPPGGAILGPGLADLQGQMAAAKLGLMQSLPGLYNQPIGQQQNASNSAAQSLMNTAQANTGSQVSQPLGPQIGNMIGSGLQGLGQSIEQSNQSQLQQQRFDELMKGISLSGAR